MIDLIEANHEFKQKKLQEKCNGKNSKKDKKLFYLSHPLYLYKIIRVYPCASALSFLLYFQYGISS